MEHQEQQAHLHAALGFQYHPPFKAALQGNGWLLIQMEARNMSLRHLIVFRGKEILKINQSNQPKILQ